MPPGVRRVRKAYTLFQRSFECNFQNPSKTYGYFWLVDEPDNRLLGILTISEKGDAALEIFGNMDASRSGPNRQLTGTMFRILGVTDQGGCRDTN